MLSGLLNIAKPAGITSRRVVDRVQALAAPAKAGHAGTLDPMATGVLVVCVGAATRLIEFVQGQRKEYRAEFLLGKRSDTDDVTGNVVDVPDVAAVPRTAIEAALPRFVGRFPQVPPAFSAVHVEGRRAYDLARKGRFVDLAPREVEVFGIAVSEYEWPRLTLDIECGSGTYVRSIGRDLGEALGCGAAMSALVRTRVGVFALADAIALDDLDAGRIARHLLPLTTAVAGMPQVSCGTEEAQALRQGRRCAAGGTALPPGARVACVLEGELIAVAEIVLQPERLLQPKVVIPAGR